MESFDQSLKHLLQHEPASFIRFALADPGIEVVEALPSGLPSRGRDVDGTYLIALGEELRAAHVEFHRRHQSLDDLAVDVAEAQIRLFRRERMRVFSLVWDLYGHRDDPVLEARTLLFGAEPDSACSQCVYQRVNLRGLGWKELLASAPPALWPLVPLTRDGANETAILQARDAIEGRAELTTAERADHLAVLWFVAGAEGLPAQMVKAWIAEGRLMESELFRSLVADVEAKAKAEGKTEGKTETKAETIIEILVYRLGPLDAAIREKIQKPSDIDAFNAWFQKALRVNDVGDARKLAEMIQMAPTAPESP